MLSITAIGPTSGPIVAAVAEHLGACPLARGPESAQVAGPIVVRGVTIVLVARIRDSCGRAWGDIAALANRAPRCGQDTSPRV